MTRLAYLQPFCNHTRQEYTWRPSFGRIQNPLYRTLSCQVDWVSRSGDTCSCECHNPETDAWEIQWGAYPPEWADPYEHELLYKVYRHVQMEVDKEAKGFYRKEIANGLNLLLKKTVQTTVDSLTYIWQQKLASELIQMWHEMNEEMHIILEEKNGEGWELVYRDMQTIERIMWNNYIVRPDPVNGYLLGYCNHEWKGN